MLKKTYNSDRDSNTLNRLPLYWLVVQQLLIRLTKEEFKAGQYLPSEWALANQLAVSQGTVRKALNILVQQGVLSRQQGVGTLVTHKNLDWGDYPLSVSPAEFTDRTTLIWPTKEVLSITSQMPDDETIRQLNLDKTQAVWKIIAVWRSAYHTIAVDEVFVPKERVADLNSRFTHRRMSFYAFLLQQYQILPMTKRQWLWMRDIELDYQRLLKLKQDDACLCWGKLSCDAHGSLIEWRRRFLHLGNFTLHMGGF